MGFWEYVANDWPDLLELAWGHVVIVGVSILIAGLLGVGLAVLTYERPAARNLVLRVTGTFLTIPSLALYALLLPLLGLNARTVVVALTMYALLPIVRNTITGLRGVDPAVVESAKGMGMNRWRRLYRIELPLAWPVVITGIRVATLIIVGIAALGAIINGPGLGDQIFEGLNRVGTPFAFNFTMSGLLGVVLVGVLFDVGYFVLNRLTVSKGIK